MSLWFKEIIPSSLPFTPRPPQVSTAALTFAALQSASLCLACTPPERMAAAMSSALSPLRVVGFPADELVLTLLLALRFISMVGSGSNGHMSQGVMGRNPSSQSSMCPLPCCTPPLDAHVSMRRSMHPSY